eukprot:IDg21198t1
MPDAVHLHNTSGKRCKVDQLEAKNAVKRAAMFITMYQIYNKRPRAAMLHRLVFL